jgi:hydroxyacylglutathione hydrolase
MKQVAPGVWHIPGFPANWINVYLVGDVLIDASRRGAGPSIARELGERKLAAVALTHVHPDHQGSAAFLCEAYGVPLWCHAGDRGRMEGTEVAAPGNFGQWLSDRLFTGPPHPVARTLEAGEEIEGFKVHHTPGHSPGHVTFFRESDGVAIAGDVVNAMNLMTGRPGLHEPPAFFSFDPAQNRESIRRLAEMDPQVLCLGHGAVWRDRPSFRRFVQQLPD